MPSIRLTSPEVFELKRLARAQLPNVRNTHLLEALASGFGFNTWAALNAALSDLPAGEALTVDFLREAVLARLVTLGYPDAETRTQLSMETVIQLLERPVIPVDEIVRSQLSCMIARATVTVSATLESMEAQGSVSPQDSATIRSLISRRSVILITGTTGSGKSTMMRALMPYMAAHAGARQRVGLVQHAREFEQLPANVTEVFRNQGGDTPAYVTSTGVPDDLSGYFTLFADELSMHSPAVNSRMFSAWRETPLGLGSVRWQTPILGGDSDLDAVDAIISMTHEGRRVRVGSVALRSKPALP